jgi:NAD(P)H-flavin reductase
MISAQKEFGSYKLVKVSQYAEKPDDQSTEDEPVSRYEDCAIPSSWIDLEVLSVTPYNHDTSIFRFALPHGYSRLQLPLGSFLLVRCPYADHDGTPPAIRPYTSITDDTAMIHEVENSTNGEKIDPYFELLCKRYDQWGQKETPQTHFLFTRTNHSYKPPGIVSNYIHKLQLGQHLSFKYNHLCASRLPDSFSASKSLTLIAVGVGIAPMIPILRQFVQDQRLAKENRTLTNVEKITLLYGARSVRDILLREMLEDWYLEFSDCLKIVFCVGSRWANVHWGAKSKTEYAPPPLPEGFHSLRCPAELGWVNKEHIREHAFAAADDTKVVVCGLPGVYDKLCGERNSRGLPPHCVLTELGYTEDMIVKL